MAPLNPGTSGPATRTDPPVPTDAGMVTRPIFPAFPVIVTEPQPATTSAVTSVASSIVSVTLLAVAATRLMATFFNRSNARLFLRLGAGATTVAAGYTVIIEAQSYWELPYRYTGIIDGIWSPVVSGFVNITELTP